MAKSHGQEAQATVGDVFFAMFVVRMSSDNVFVHQKRLTGLPGDHPG